MSNRIYHILYMIMLLSAGVIVTWALSHYEGPSTVEESFGEASSFLEGWVNAEGDVIDTTHLHEVDGMPVMEEYSVFNRIPEQMEEGQYLCFRSKNIFFQVYCDGTLMYEPYVPENVMYTDSTGTRWHYVPIASKDMGKEIEIRVSRVYESGRASVDNIYIGEPARVIMDNIEDKLVAFITCVLMLFVGALLVVADIPINMQAQKNHELLYLGLFSISVATWCLTETHLMQYFMGDARSVQLISCFALAMISLPMVLYLDSAFGFKRRIVAMVVIGFTFGMYVLSLIMHFAGIADLHETLHFSHISLVMAAVLLLYTITRHTFVMGKSKGRNMYRFLRGVGLCGLSIATVVDLYRYYSENSNDTAMFVRIGLLIFIICFGSSSLEKTINAVKLGARTELVAQLAYKDGLTGIGNRTAFEEELLDLDKRREELSAIGILIFDVNDLKPVNDNMGHRVGDAMLVASAEIIEQAFASEAGDCFRIGGDEFAILLSGEQVKERCESGLARFEQMIEKYNTSEKREFMLKIAHGFEVYDKSREGLTLMNIYEMADVHMYENKKQMKENDRRAQA